MYNSIHPKTTVWIMQLIYVPYLQDLIWHFLLHNMSRIHNLVYRNISFTTMENSVLENDVITVVQNCTAPENIHIPITD